jgi:hypothetical protein
VVLGSARDFQAGTPARVSAAAERVSAAAR